MTNLSPEALALWKSLHHDGPEDRDKCEICRQHLTVLDGLLRDRKTVEWAYRQAPGWWAAHQLWETTGDRTRDECIDAILKEMEGSDD